MRMACVEGELLRPKCAACRAIGRALRPPFELGLCGAHGGSWQAWPLSLAHLPGETVRAANFELLHAFAEVWVKKSRS